MERSAWAWMPVAALLLSWVGAPRVRPAAGAAVDDASGHQSARRPGTGPSPTLPRPMVSPSRLRGRPGPSRFAAGLARFSRDSQARRAARRRCDLTARRAA